MPFSEARNRNGKLPFAAGLKAIGLSIQPGAPSSLPTFPPAFGTVPTSDTQWPRPRVFSRVITLCRGLTLPGSHRGMGIFEFSVLAQEGAERRSHFSCFSARGSPIHAKRRWMTIRSLFRISLLSAPGFAHSEGRFASLGPGSRTALKLQNQHPPLSCCVDFRRQRIPSEAPGRHSSRFVTHRHARSSAGILATNSLMRFASNNEGPGC